MNETARNDALQELHGRHEELLAELDSLEKRIETTLAATRPPTASPEPAAIEAAKAA